MSSGAKVQQARLLNHSQYFKASAMMSTDGNRLKSPIYQREKEFVTSFNVNQKPLSPSCITEDPRNKKLGGQSRKLRVTDFELVRTLGTGALIDLVRGATG
jgi:hypothetical protein